MSMYQMSQTYDQLYLQVLRLVRNQDLHHLRLVWFHFLLRLSRPLFLFLLQAMALAKVLLRFDLPRSLVRFRLYQAKAQSLLSLPQSQLLPCLN